MQTIIAKRVLIFVIAVFSMNFMVGCSHLEKAPNREGYVLYHKPLPEADRALEEARMAGKDKQCPAEFDAAKNMVDKTYEIYMACHTQEAMDMAREAIGKIKALCPPPPTCDLTSNPKEIVQGQSAILRLTTSATANSAALDGTEVAATGGTKTVSPFATTSYTAKVSGPGGSTTCSVTVNVTVPPPPPPPPAPVVEPVKIILEDIHFDFDKATLTKAATGILDSNIKTLRENQGIKVQVEGHTCAHGTEDYNMALGERRANAVQEYLAHQGIAATRMTTISYGETRLAMPEIPTAHNKNSEEAKENRRVHFEVIVK